MVNNDALINYLQVFQHRVRIGKSVVELINLMEMVLSSVNDFDYIRDKLKKLEDAISEILKEIEKCSRYIRKYIDTEHNFVGNARLRQD